MEIIVHSGAGSVSCLIGYTLADQENSWGSSTLVSIQKKRFPPLGFQLGHGTVCRKNRTLYALSENLASGELMGML